MNRDPRLTPARPDLAAAHLRGKLEAARYVTGRPMHVRVGIADLRREPSALARLDTQVLYGEEVMLYEQRDGWTWVQLVGDGYVGYLSADTLVEGLGTATHRVCVNRTFVYPAADVKAPVLAALPLGARVNVEDEEAAFARLAGGGFVFAPHLEPTLDESLNDFVAVAEGFLDSPYLWGGKSSLGIDCSGLVQIALAAAGIAAPRDTDLQERALGSALPVREKLEDLRRGDLVFWKGHVAMLRDAHELLHANAYRMLVACEPLSAVRKRIRQSGGGEITAIKRL
ncbi:MAG: NlpC/P60 family protein [Methylovirgula sp.]